MYTISTNSKAAFLVSLKELSDRHYVIEHEQFNRDFSKLQVEDFTAAEWKKVVDFSTDQVGQWKVEWLFSPVAAPNFRASTELEAWRELWKFFLNTLINQVPEVDEPLREAHDLTAAQYLLSRKLQHDAGNPWARITTPVLGRAAIILNRVGLQSIGLRLYSLALYPPGSVGRSEA
jgi:hypothetical protein